MAEGLILPLIFAAGSSYLGWLFSKKDVSSLGMPGTAYKKPLIKGYGSFRVEGTAMAFESASKCFVAGDWKGKSNGRKGKTASSYSGKGGMFSYSNDFFGTFMYAFCQGTVSPYGMIVQGSYHGMSPNDTWMNANLTFFNGAVDQAPWSTHQTLEGDTKTPAYKGIACCGIYNMPLTEYGNTFPSQMSLYCYDTILGQTPSVGSIVLDICKQAHIPIPYIDVSELSEQFVYGTVEGLYIGGHPIGGNPHGTITTGEGFIFEQNNTSYKEPIAQLASVYLFYKTQLIDGTIAFKHYDRGSGAAVTTISTDSLGAIEGSGSSVPFNVKKTIVDILELPSALWLGFYNIDLLGQKDTVPARWASANHVNEQSVDVNMYMTTAAAAVKAQVMLQHIYQTSSTYEFELPPNETYIRLIVGDLIKLPTGETVQLTEVDIGINYIISCKAQKYSGSSNLGIGSVSTALQTPSNTYRDNIPTTTSTTSVVTGTSTPNGTTSTTTTSVGTVTTVVDTTVSGTTTTVTTVQKSNGLAVLDINLISDSDHERGLYLVATGRSVNVFSSYDAGTTYSNVAVLSGPGVIAHITSGSLSSWIDPTYLDATSSLTIPQSAGTLSSITSGQASAQNQNVAFIGSLVTDGATSHYVGELVVFETVTVSGSNYVITDFTRGIRGTEYYMSSHATGETFFLVDGLGSNVSHTTIQDQYIGQEIYLQENGRDDLQ